MAPEQEQPKDTCGITRDATSGDHGPLKAVIFDLFHTLITLDSAPPGTSTPEILGVDPAVWTHKVIEESPHHALGAVRDPYESVRMIAHAIDPSISDDKIRAAVEKRPIRFRAALLDIRPEILAGVARLKQTSLKIGLISNAGLDEVEAWDDSPLAPYFDATLVSCHEGIMKPDPEIYLRAAKRLGVEPGDCLFVGDGGSSEHKGARRAGMRTALYLELLKETSPSLAARRPRNTDWVLCSFTDLVDLSVNLAKMA
ncbi:HAD family hydrolase [Candidatus Eisenbacteria bacterium]|uniref:HAD family hydrolase n=1 Tax=Eiseniibacteriota bacterium TaxID=2212470 RepID=A0ABV6YIM2_UNCEI